MSNEHSLTWADACAQVTDNFTGITRGWFPGLLRDGELEETLELNPPTEPSVRVSSTIRINLERGGTGECYVWTKEEATLIRDALIEELSNPTPPPVWIPQYPTTYPGIGTSPWVTYNVCSTDDGQRGPGC